MACVCTCGSYSILGACLPQGRSFTAISCPHKVTACHLSPALVCTIQPRWWTGRSLAQPRESSTWLFVREHGESWAVTGSIEINTTTDWKRSPHSWGSICSRRNCWVVLNTGQNVLAKQTSHPRTDVWHTTRPTPPWSPSLTPFSLFQAACRARTHSQAHARFTAVISRLLSLSLSHCLAVSPSSLRSVHLLRCLFPHVYLWLPAHSHMALLTQFCHAHPNMLFAASEWQMLL